MKHFSFPRRREISSLYEVGWHCGPRRVCIIFTARPLILIVRRSHLIEDVFNQLNQFENEDLRRELMVSIILNIFAAERRKT